MAYNRWMTKKWISGLMLAFLLAPDQGHGQAASPSEYQLKAAFLYHFAQFIQWPSNAFENPTSPMVIAILGDNPFGGGLEKAVSGKSINNHPLTVREIRSPTEATNSCHLLFISSSEKKRLPEILTALRGTSVLTVGEMERFTESGGIINFTMEGGKIRFQINAAAAENAGLKISSKLLSLAFRPAR
jgi:hypothetical protein